MACRAQEAPNASPEGGAEDNSRTPPAGLVYLARRAQEAPNASPEGGAEDNSDTPPAGFFWLGLPVGWRFSVGGPSCCLPPCCLPLLILVQNRWATLENWTHRGFFFILFLGVKKVLGA